MKLFVAIPLFVLLSIAYGGLGPDCFDDPVDKKAPKSEDKIGKHIQKIIDEYAASMKDLKGTVEPRDEDESTDVLISNNGYPSEIHTVTTEDCYILQMHRIPFGIDSPVEAGVIKPAVLLQHGIIMSSADWVIPYPEKGLGYILADAGYDVWLGNFRGNTYGRDHCDLNPDRNEFWHFSWDQTGKWDLPAMIDTIVAYTGQQKIHYIGHSMGTTSLMVMGQERPEYMEKIIMGNMMSPVAYMEHMQGPIRLLAPWDDLIEIITEVFGLGEFLPSNWFWDLIADLFCDEFLFFDPWLCESVIFLLVGYDESQMNDTLLEDIVRHTPAGSSTYTVIHYGQEVTSEGFHKYDFDRDNDKCYGVDYPPEYNPEVIDMPLSLYWGQNDWLAMPEDVFSLESKLPNVYDSFEVDWEQWNHMDFIYGIDAYTLVYPQVLDNMARAQAEFYPLDKMREDVEKHKKSN